ncbi:MAG: class I SAM-dependent methyltransferase [Deltaproteobacteria bacterium]|nr:MAG: class I SAM-dependent methyltransferase [Deltaproteobacteria bacterium]
MRSAGNESWGPGRRGGLRWSSASMSSFAVTATALDLGAGCGYVVRDLRRRGIDAEGVELSPYAVERSADIGMESHLRVGRLQDALDTTSDLGLITCLDVLPHREVDEREVLASAARRLRPGGLMLLRVPAYQRLYGHHDRYVHQLRRYGSGDVEQLAVQAGLRVARRSFANMLLFGIVLAARALERLRPSLDARDRSSNRIWPAPVNAALRSTLQAEARLIGHGVALPFGSSLLVLLERSL